MNTGHDGLRPFAPRLEEVAHLVAEDQQDDADAERPAPDQRVAAERDEDERELREEAELRDQRRAATTIGAVILPTEAAPVGAARLDRLVVALGELGPPSPTVVLLRQEPRPIHSSPPS